VDVLSRYIVSRRALNALRAERALNALEVALWTPCKSSSGKCIPTLRDVVVTLVADDVDQTHPHFLGHAPRGEVVLLDVTTH
jgi:hypothetical protein